ncbi:TBC1 domain-containing protein [Echinococcus granulosus]|uniref:TBC1 domain-containing protein n=1 Tax=Echinococcus granulosus TaxID=6210 RepID=W6UU08_ECHGR|nr:TBC1 domain-containing protein [Echinococcus granulosus]EUB64793.1 TBC1 domain-containing protein [Echinococcus granulosus]
MCEVTCEEVSFGTSNSSMLLMDEDSQWVACGQKFSEINHSSHSKGENEHMRKNDIESFSNLPLELCDPMRRKITSLKPSLTPGAGTRIMRRRKMRQDFMEESISETEEAFRQWREAMRAMARLPEGIPQQFRRRIWLLLATHQLNSQHINWPRLAQTLFAPCSTHTSEVEERLGRQIEKDLHRTGSGAIVTTEANRTALKRVLTAYTRWNRRVGYCQGFNILASVILNVMELDEEAALKVMIFLIDYVLPESYFARNLQALSVDVAVFGDLLALRQPMLASHLQKLQRDAAFEALNFTSSAATRPSFEPPLTDLFAIQWFVTLFSTCLPMNTVLRIWDAILLEGSEVGLRAGLVVMEILSQDLMKLPSADKFYSSMAQWMEEITEGADRPGLKTVEFISLMYNIAPLPWPRLGDLRKRYAAAADGRREEVPTVLYGDGYDEEAKKTKSKWWNINVKQVVEESAKSPPRASIQPAVIHQGDEGMGTKPGTDSALPRQLQTSPSASEQNFSPLLSADESFTLEMSDANSVDEILMGSGSMRHFPFFLFDKFRPQRRNETRKLLVMYEDQKRRRVEVNYDAYLLGDEALITQIIGDPTQVENQSYADSLQVTHLQLQQQRFASPLAINNRHYTPHDPIERTDLLQRTSFQFDDSFLQTINEWQRRNAAALASAGSEDSDSDISDTPDLLSHSVFPFEASLIPRPQRTLLSIVAQRRIAELASPNTNEMKSSTHSPPLSLSRSSVLAKTIIRDRTRPKESFAVSRGAVKPVQQSGVLPASRSPSSVSMPSHEARASAPTQTGESPAPPWAAAMAAIAVVPRPFDKRDAI